MNDVLTQFACAVKPGRRVLTRREMYENAFHEAGHAVIALYLGVGPLRCGMKLWAQSRKQTPTTFGEVKMCLWVPSDPVASSEIEIAIMAVLAGQLAQCRLTPTYESEGWAALEGDYVADLKMPDWGVDNALIAERLKHLPLRPGRSAASLRVTLSDRTQRLLDANWPAVKAVARAVLKAKHHSLSGKQIAKVVNRTTDWEYRHVRRCHDLLERAQ